MASIEVKNNHCKNDICNSIRSALTTKSETQLPPIDRKERIFDPLDDSYQNFKKEFTEAGGLLYEFEVERSRMSDSEYVSQRLADIYNQIKYAVEAGRWTRVLNASAHLSKILRQFNIDFVDTLPESEHANAVIVYAEHLVARTGHVALSQRGQHMLYPSIAGLARNIIVLSGNASLVSDLKDLTGRMTTTQPQENRPDDLNLKFNMMEILRPLPFEEGEEPTVAKPRMILMMIVEK